MMNIIEMTLVLSSTVLTVFLAALWATDLLND